MKKIFANALLAVVAIVLASVLVPGAFLFVLLRYAWSAESRNALRLYLIRMLFELARGIDQLGNGVCFEFFNWALLKNDKIFPFGNVDETISSVIGRNKQVENLSWFGRLLDLVLDGIDVGHSIRSIGN